MGQVLAIKINEVEKRLAKEILVKNLLNLDQKSDNEIKN